MTPGSRPRDRAQRFTLATGTALGQSIAFGTSGAAQTVNGAEVVNANIDCSNGMVHVIDTVLVPE